jgi:hypothetical protein
LAGDKRGNANGPFPVHSEAYGDVVGTVSYGKGLVVESTMAVKLESLDQPLRAFFECAPATNKTLAYLPKNTIVYASTNCVELGTYFAWLQKNLKDRPDSPIAFDGVFQGISAKTGVDIEKDILAFFGRGFSYAVLNGSREGNVGFPGIQLFFQMKDRSKVETSLQELLEKPASRSWLKEVGVDLSNMNQGNVPITYLRYRGDDMRFFFLSALTPCYAFVDDILVIGSELEGVRQMVDLSRGQGSSILTDRRFNEVRRLVGEKNNGMTYVNLKAASRLLKGFSAQGMLRGAAGTGSEREEDLQVFFRVLETLNYLWSAIEFEGDRLRFLFYVAL